ncbi:MAG: bifunctional phosphopantothenoylcysteine decarboxylase/phosphopantothenate--cysteine ligase CoaBC [Oligoflexales bacterium]
MNSDLSVTASSDALSKSHIDVVICGSIGAIEAPRLIRGLRRLGATVTAFMTQSSQSFITAQSVAWACGGKEVVSGFSSGSDHIAHHDALVIAPASANFISKIAHGVADDVASSLAMSYLGSRKPVLLLPNMHESMYESPATQANLRKISEWGVGILSPRAEEHKFKFPDPEILADEISHAINYRPELDYVFLSMGAMRGYIDDVRYISNYSTGKLGSLVATELYRQGFATTVACGPSEHKPRVFSAFVATDTYEDMAEACMTYAHQKCKAGIFMASVLDFVPKERKRGKVSSSEELGVEFRKTDKILRNISCQNRIKVGFKLEASLSEDRATAIAQQYCSESDLSMIVVNALDDIKRSHHRSLVFERADDDTITLTHKGESKSDIVMCILRHLKSGLRV